MNKNRLKPLLSEEMLRQGVRRMAEEIAADYGNRPLMIVGVLTGSVIFLADLIRLLPMPLKIGLIQASSYRGAVTSPEKLRINNDMLLDVVGQEVLLLDDIFDTGQTLVEVARCIRSMGAISVRTAVLLRKAGRQLVDERPDYIGFDIPNAFVVGYGLDFDNQYRNLPFVAALTEGETDEDRAT